MLLSLYILLIFIESLVLVQSYQIDILCPLTSRFKSDCATFFKAETMNLTHITLNIIEDTSAIGNKIVFDLEGSNSNTQNDAYIIFYPIFTFKYQCDHLEYYSSTIVKATQNCIIYYILFSFEIVLEILQKGGRSNYIILGESAAKEFCESLVDYIKRLDLGILENKITDTPASEAATINSAITDEDKTAILLFYNDPSLIESFISVGTIQTLKSRVKIISFGVIDEFTTTAAGKSTLYEGTYSVNGYFESCNMSISVNNDVFFISYNSLLYIYQ